MCWEHFVLIVFLLLSVSFVYIRCTSTSVTLVIHNDRLPVNIGQNLTSGILHNIEGIGLKMCAKQCVLRKTCNLIGYNFDNRLCKLGEISAVVETCNDVRTVTSYRNRWKYVEELTGKCANHTCPENSMCISLTRRTEPFCIVTGCGNPPYRSNTLYPVSFSSKLVGSTASYSDCVPEKNDHGNVQMTRCLASGQWSSLTYACCDCSTSYTVIGDCECLVKRGKKTYGDAFEECGSKTEQFAMIFSAEHLQRIAMFEFSGTMRINGEKVDGKWILSNGTTMEWIDSVPGRLKEFPVNTDTLAIKKLGSEVMLTSVDNSEKKSVLCQLP